MTCIYVLLYVPIYFPNNCAVSPLLRLQLREAPKLNITSSFLNNICCDWAVETKVYEIKIKYNIKYNKFL